VPCVGFTWPIWLLCSFDWGFLLKEASVKTAWCGVHPTYLTAWGEMTTTIGKLLGQKMVDEIDCFVPWSHPLDLFIFCEEFARVFLSCGEWPLGTPWTKKALKGPGWMRRTFIHHGWDVTSNTQWVGFLKEPAVQGRFYDRFFDFLENRLSGLLKISQIRGALIVKHWRQLATHQGRLLVSHSPTISISMRLNHMDDIDESHYFHV